MTKGALLSSPVPLRKWMTPSIITGFALILLTVIALLPSAPIFQQIPDTDSGVFLYMGSQILHGAVPYRDMWDHKPPLIFFINALGLMANSLWGVWVLEVAAISAAVLMLYSFLRRFFGWLPTIFALAAFIGNLFFVSEYGNLPEEYGLLLQAATLVLLADAFSKKQARWQFLAIGLLLGLAVSLKQTLLGTGLAVIICILISAIWMRDWRKLLSYLWIGIGFLSVWLIWVLYFWSQNALLYFWDQSILYNFLYSDVTIIDRIDALLIVLSYMYNSSGFFTLGILSWLIVLPFLYVNNDQLREIKAGRMMGGIVLLISLVFLMNGLWDDRTNRLFSFASLSLYRWMMIGIGAVLGAASISLLTGWAFQKGQKLFNRLKSEACPGLLLPLGIAFIDLPLELALSSLSARDYHHYYIPLLPALCILIAFLVWSILSARGSSMNRLNKWSWLVVLSLLVLFSGWYMTINAIRRTENLQVQKAVNYIQASSQPGEGILQWGTNTRLYFLAGRHPVDQYLYQQPMFTLGYVTPDKIQHFLLDLQRNPPVLILDTRPNEMPLVIPESSCTHLNENEFVTQAVKYEREERLPDDKVYPLPYIPLEMKSVYFWICENYERVSAPEKDLDTWRYYRLRSTHP